MKKLSGRLLLFAFLLAIWLLLSAPFSREELIAGAIVSALISLFPFGSIPIFSEMRLTPKALIWGIAYLFVFLFELLKSNLDVAFRVLHPKLPIHPGIVKVKTKLNSRMGRLALANSITLTPGTITVETKDEYFYIHWIDVRARNIEETTRNIVSKFERYLEVIFG
ncbi:MAG TPA: hypothetical protein ENN41_10985 [Sediminispirochaeta sp.]|nr:hypothetical protein [Sediminispirochaeta sp.]